MKTHVYEAMKAILKKYHLQFTNCIPYETLEDITQDIILKMLLKEDGYFKNSDHLHRWGCKTFFRSCFHFLKQRETIIHYEQYDINWLDQYKYIAPEVIQGTTRFEKTTMDKFHELCEYILRHAGRKQSHAELLVAVAYEDRRKSWQDVCRERNIDCILFNYYLRMGRKKLRQLMWDIYAVPNFNTFRNLRNKC